MYSIEIILKFIKESQSINTSELNTEEYQRGLKWRPIKKTIQKIM